MEGEIGTSNNLEQSRETLLGSASSTGLSGALFVTAPCSKAAIRERRDVEGGICKPPPAPTAAGPGRRRATTMRSAYRGLLRELSRSVCAIALSPRAPANKRLPVPSPK